MTRDGGYRVGELVEVARSISGFDGFGGDGWEVTSVSSDGSDLCLEKGRDIVWFHRSRIVGDVLNAKGRR